MTKALSLVSGVVGIIKRIITFNGVALDTQVTTLKMTKSTGAVVKEERTHLDVKSQSINRRKMMKMKKLY